MESASNISIARKLKAALISGLDFILPPRCPACSDKILAHGFLCGSCWGDLQPIAAPYCTICALPFEFETDEGAICLACVESEPEYNWARAAVLYDGLGKSVVLRLKHGGVSTCAPVMVQMMAAALKNAEFDVIMPVPLHWSKMILRRFNQSLLLAKGLSKKLTTPLDAHSLSKIKKTKNQAGLSKRARFQNVASVFTVRESAAKTLKGKRVLLVDDVLTTGATASSCAKALKKVGVNSVGVIAFARVGKPVAG